MSYLKILDNVQEYVNSYMLVHTGSAHTYHNWEHTGRVAAATEFLAEFYKVAERDKFILLTAAWFHDVGYLVEDKSPEEAGADLASAYLKDKDVEEEVIVSIRRCILATAFHQKPGNHLEEIIKDASTFYLGTNNFAQQSNRLRKELEVRRQKKISKEDWKNETIQLLEKHNYFTTYCRQNLEKVKKKNLDDLKTQNAEASDFSTNATEGNTSLQGKPKTKKKKRERPDKGIETMFRVTSGNSQRLSDQADTKAHILISVNSIIISVLLGTVVRKIDNNGYLTIPTVMLLTVSLVTIVFSILATRPRVPKGTFSKQDVKDKKVNLLFFGNFYKMPFEEYAQGMQQMMEDRGFLYMGLIRDVYSQGVVLGRKYRMLTIAYNTFMFGLIISVIVFFIASKYYS